jgi:hypothetical protein
MPAFAQTGIDRGEQSARLDGLHDWGEGMRLMAALRPPMIIVMNVHLEWPTLIRLDAFSKKDDVSLIVLMVTSASLDLKYA